MFLRSNHNQPHGPALREHIQQNLIFAQQIIAQHLGTMALPAAQQPPAPVQYSQSYSVSHWPHAPSSGISYAAAPSATMGYQNSLPVNTQHGHVRTEARKIHISNLPFDCNENELSDLLNQYSNPVRPSIKRNPHGQATSATAQYRTAAEALQAKSALNGKTLKRRILRVKVDQDQTAVSHSAGAARPPIAHGSSNAQVSFLPKASGYSY